MSESAERTRLYLLSLTVGVVAFLCSGLMVPPKTHPVLWGKAYSQMSLDPFAFSGRFPHRILSPALGHFSQLSGARFLFFSLLVSALLLCLTFYFARRRGAQRLDAFLLTLALGAMAPVLNANLWAGYTDSLSYLLLLLSVLNVDRRGLFWLIFAINLFNHEQVLGLLPWLLFLRWSRAGDYRSELIYSLVASLPYLVFRVFLDSQSSEASLNANYYLAYLRDPSNIWGRLRVFLPGLFMTFGFFWTVVVWYLRSSEVAIKDKGGMLLYMGCVLVMLLLAHDTNRVVSLYFVGVLLMSLDFLSSPENRVPFLLMLFFTAIVPYRPFVGIWPEPGPRIDSWNIFAAVMIATCVVAGVRLASRATPRTVSGWGDDPTG